MACAYCSTANRMPHVSDMISVAYGALFDCFAGYFGTLHNTTVIVWAARGDAHGLGRSPH
jgi:hypothetical protein